MQDVVLGHMHCTRQHEHGRGRAINMSMLTLTSRSGPGVRALYSIISYCDLMTLTSTLGATRTRTPETSCARRTSFASDPNESPPHTHPMSTSASALTETSGRQKMSRARGTIHHTATEQRGWHPLPIPTPSPLYHCSSSCAGIRESHA